jgi:hypothetical protein
MSSPASSLSVGPLITDRLAGLRAQYHHAVAVSSSQFTCEVRGVEALPTRYRVVVLTSRPALCDCLGLRSDEREGML